MTRTAVVIDERPRSVGGSRLPITLMVPIALIVLTALIVGCTRTEATNGDARSIDSAAPPASEPIGSTVAPAPTTTPAPAPTIRLASSSGPSQPVGPADGSALVGVRRDCGMTATLSDGRTLWVYCDTGVWGADQRLRFFVNTSAALADPSAPLTMVDALDATGHPTAFLQSDATYPVCTGGRKASVWPMSAVTVPRDGTDRVLIWYQNVCLAPDGAESFDIGLAELDYTPGQPTTQALTARVVNARLFPKLGRGGSFGVAAEYVDGSAYLYWCDLGPAPCFLARVPVDHAQDHDAYRYWSGPGWNDDPATMVALALGDPLDRIKPSVRWVPALGTFAMVDVDALNDLVVRFATRPEGPWTPPQTVHLDECATAYPSNCFAAEVQPQLSDPTHLAIGYFDPTQPFGTGSPTRVVSVARTPPFAPA